jgi:lipopolysaccharide/colanic/teichoic acid biosynthesis glycosyltransferase
MLDASTHPATWRGPVGPLSHKQSMRQRVSNATYPAIKRGVDIAVSGALLILLSPLLLAIAIAIKLDSPGPMIYVQRRGGLNGRIFDFYKFRSMTNGRDHTREHREFAQAYINGHTPAHQLEETGRPIYKPVSNGHSVTRVGRWLRRTSLDELPQLVNILKGDMSLVGPRPSIDYEVAMYTEQQYQRLVVIPGLTGWAQINGRSSLSFDEIVRFDMEYIAQRSLRRDLAILWATIPMVLKAQDAG